MPVESAADRAAFLDADEFGVTSSFTHAGGTAVEIAGIFDNDYLDLEVEGEVGVASRSPRFVCRTADLDDAGGANDGDSLVVSGVTYKVRIVKPDGTGMSELKLEKQ